MQAGKDVRIVLFGGCATAVALGAGVRLAGAARTPQTAPQAAQVAFTLGARPPAGAIVLFSGKQQELKDNFYKRYT
ncbi:MAG TPA: hypothetical protein VGS41_11570, partial [Chthonomonadales bacterium]|nr:hypothetical protein [Chthonomonadales bacterium]